MRIVNKTLLWTAVLLLLIRTGFSLANVTAITNVKGYTYTTQQQFVTFDTLVFQAGKVLAVGDSTLLKQYVDATIINGKGKTLLPGITDGHGHMLGLGFNLLNVDIRGIDSAKQSVQTVAKFAKNNPSLLWIKGRGWNQEIWSDGKYPTAKQLDEYISDRPVYLRRVDSHAVWLNSKAMALAGIDKNTLAPPGGEIVKDENGEPTGVLIDNAESLVTAIIPEPSRLEMAQALDMASKHLLSLGITSVHDAGIDKATYDLYRQQAQEQALKVRIYGMLAATDSALPQMLKTGYVRDDKDFLSIRSVKIYGDGALGSRGAALLAPYQDDHDNQGLLVTSKQALVPLFNLVLGHRFQINIHAIGDRANRIALDQFQRVYQQPGAELIHGKELRHRIEHAQVVHPEDIPRFKTLDIIPSMQPTHATSDKDMAPKRVGEKRLAGAYAWQQFLQQGSRIVAGSDFPVELANPMFGLHAAVTRQDRNNQPAHGWRNHDSMSVQQAFKAFTLDAAYGAHQEHILGGLQAGKWADFILLDNDIFKMNKTEIWQTKVLATWVAGNPVYTAPE